MPFKFFAVPLVELAEAESALNGFLGSHRILNVDRRWVDQGSNSFWMFCVDYLAPRSGGPSPPRLPSARGRVDYKEQLQPEEFAVFSKLRDLRKKIAQEEAVPVYAVFTNDQLAQMVQSRVGTKTALEQVAGVGDGRVEKYGPRVLTVLAGAWGNDREAGGKPV